MMKRVSLQRSITLSVLSIGLLSGAFGLAYASWQTKHSFREAIGLGFQELARQSADKVGLILEKKSSGWNGSAPYRRSVKQFKKAPG